MIVDDATDEDWPAIDAFFARIVAGARTYAYPPDLSEAQARALWTEEPPGSTVVAVEGDVVLGPAARQPGLVGLHVMHRRPAVR